MGERRPVRAKRSGERSGRLSALRIALLLLLLGVCHPLPAQAQNRAAAEAMKQAMELLQTKGNEAMAIQPLTEAIRQAPTWYLPHVQLAIIRGGLQQYEPAIAEMEKVLGPPLRFPNDQLPNYWTLLGKFRYEAEMAKPEGQRKFDKAVDAFQKAVGFDKKYHEANYYLARIALSKGEYSKAADYIKAALDGQPGSPQYRTVEADVKYRAGDLDGASAELKEVLEKLSGMKDSREYYEANELNNRVSADLSQRFYKKILLYGGPAVLLVIGIVLGLSMMKGKGGRAPGIDVGADVGSDGSSYEEISAMALRRLCALTQMAHGVMYVTTIDGDEMRAKATLTLEPDEVKPLPIDLNELPRWVERNDGKPFLFKAEKKEGGFIKAFPDAREVMEPLQIRIGVPFLFQDRLLGMAFLGVEESKDILRLKKLYDRSQGDIYRIAVEYGAALHRLFEDEMAYIDVLTKFKSRRYVEENLPRSLVNAEDAGRKGAIVMLEFDQFRGLQEQYGDPQAEAVLKTVAAELKAGVPTEDDGMLARFEAGKFFAFLPVNGVDEAYQFADRLKVRVAETRISRNFPSPTASVGLAIFPDNGKKADDLIWAADRVMMGISAGGGDAIGTADGVTPAGASSGETSRGGGSNDTPPPKLTSAPSLASAPSASAPPPPPVPNTPGRPFMPGRGPVEEPAAPASGPRPFMPGGAGAGAAPPKTGFVPGFSGAVKPAEPAANAPDAPKGGAIPGFSGGGSGLLKGGGGAAKAGGGPGLGAARPSPSAPPPAASKSPGLTGGAPSGPPKVPGLGAAPAGPPKSAGPGAPPPLPTPPKVPGMGPSVPGFSGGPPKPPPLPSLGGAPKASSFPTAANKDAGSFPGAPPRFPGASPAFPGAAEPKAASFPGASPPAEPKAAFPGAPPPAEPKTAFPGAPPPAEPKTAFPGAPPPAEPKPAFPGAPPPLAEPKPAFPGAPPPFPGAAPRSPFPGAPARAAEPPAVPASAEAPAAPAAGARIPGFGGGKKAPRADLDAPTIRAPIDGPTVPWGKPAAPPPVINPAEKETVSTAEPARGPEAPPWVKAEMKADTDADAPASSSGLSSKQGGNKLLGGSSGLVAKPKPGSGGSAATGGKLFRRPGSDDAKEKPRLSAGPSAAAAPAAPAAPTLPPPLEIASSDRDPQTGFVGSEVLTRALGREIERSLASGEACSVLYFQLDRLGEISSAVGGERLGAIQNEIASLVNDFLKEGTDIPGRYSDGFAIVLPRTSSRIACNLAEQVRFTVSNLCFPGLNDNSTLSVGIAACPEHGDSSQGLLDQARQASSQAESEGGNKFKVFGA